MQLCIIQKQNTTIMKKLALITAMIVSILVFHEEAKSQSKKMETASTEKAKVEKLIFAYQDALR